MLFGSSIRCLRPAGTRSRPAFLCAGLALSLAACAPPEPPLRIAPVAPPPAAPAPAWLPAGYAREPAPNPFATDRAATEIFTPVGALAPLVMVSRWTAAEAAGLEPEPLGWLRERIRDTLQPGNELGAALPWAREGLAEGWRYPVTNAQWGEGDRGMLAGEAAIGRTPAGDLILVAALSPRDGDRALPAEVFARVPLR